MYDLVQILILEIAGVLAIVLLYWGVPKILRTIALACVFIVAFTLAITGVWQSASKQK